MKRKIIKIDDDKCNGCGLCIPDCPEGALQLIDGKARLVSDLFCDGLGACLGNCPEGAISIEEREAEPYNEAKVMEIITAKGDNTIKAHLEHLKSHNETIYYDEAVDYLKSHNFNVQSYIKNDIEPDLPVFSCPGTLSRSLKVPPSSTHSSGGPAHSEGPAEKPHTEAGAAPGSFGLENWPVQMHLINPDASYFKGSDLLLAADCTAFSASDFHNRFVRGRKLVIACPKLDNSTEIYKEKLIDLIDRGMIDTLTVLIMEVPCCTGLSVIAKNAVKSAARKVPLKEIIISVEGGVIREQWV